MRKAGNECIMEGTFATEGRTPESYEECTTPLPRQSEWSLIDASEADVIQDVTNENS